MRGFSGKSALFSESKIREMTILANKYNAINLAQGFPEFAPPKTLTDDLKRIADTGPHQYAENWGADNLRRAIAQRRSLDFGIPVKKEHILITCGSTEAVMCTFMAIFDPGDKVAVFSPYYSGYMANCIIAGVTPVFVNLYAPDFEFRKDELEDAFRQGAKAVILCNPSNPSGKVFTREELAVIVSLAEQYDAYIITDEVYEYIVYAPFKHTYISSLAGAFPRTICCSSLSKTFSITGWRLGYITAPEETIEQIRKYHDSFTVCAPSPLQEAAVTALRFGDDYYKDLNQVYENKRGIFLKLLDHAGIEHNTPQGTYYVLTDISKYGFKSDSEFCRLLVEKYGISAVPGSCFFADRNQKYIRLHFAKNDETLLRVGEKLEQMNREL